MAEFLSPEWMTEVEAAAPEVDPAVSICVQYRVIGAPAGDVEYVAELHGGRLELRPGAAARPDIRIRIPYLLALELVGQRLTLHDAVLSGNVKMQGDLDVLQTGGPALTAVSDAMASVREQTTYRR